MIFLTFLKLFLIPKKASFSLRPLVMLLFLATTYTFANSQLENSNSSIDTTTKNLLKKMEWQIQSTLKEISKNHKAQGRNLSNIQYTIDVPAKSSTSLGVIVDPSNPEDGLNILSITPNSLASELSIKPNERILKINGEVVNSSNFQSAIEKLDSLTQGEELQLEISNNGSVRVEKTQVKSDFSPGFRLEIGGTDLSTSLSKTEADSTGACGKVSVFLRPPETRRFYPARFSAINGKGVFRRKEIFVLPVGTHKIKLHELIPQGKERFRRGSGIMHAKEIEVNVEPNKIYHLASQFIPSKRFKSFNAEYWEPAVWKENDQKCELK